MTRIRKILCVLMLIQTFDGNSEDMNLN